MGFLLLLEGIEGRLDSLKGILKVAIGRLESWEERLESLEGRLKAFICESLDERSKVVIVIFNHHWRAKEVGS